MKWNVSEKRIKANIRLHLELSPYYPKYPEWYLLANRRASIQGGGRACNQGSLKCRILWYAFLQRFANVYILSI